MNMLLSTLIVISISVFSQSLSHAFKGEPEHGLEERFAKLEDVKQLLLQLEDLQQRIFILENSRSIEDDVQQNKVDIQEVKEDVVDIRINEARTDQLLSSAFSQLKNISSDVVDIKETITNIKKNVADIKVELPPIGSIIAWLPTIALPQDLPGRESREGWRYKPQLFPLQCHILAFCLSSVSHKPQPYSLPAKTTFLNGIFMFRECFNNSLGPRNIFEVDFELFKDLLILSLSVF